MNNDDVQQFDMDELKNISELAPILEQRLNAIGKTGEASTVRVLRINLGIDQD